MSLGGGNPQSGGKGGSMSSNLFGNSMTDPLGLGSDIAASGGGQFDPLGLFPVNQPGGANYIAKNGPQTPGSIPTLSGGMTGQIPGGWNGQPNFANPSSWAMPTPQGGFWNQIAQQMAGPVYTGGLQIPGVSPAMRNQPLGQPMASSGGKGAVPQNMGSTQPMNLPGNYTPGTIRGMKGFYAQ